MRWAALIPLKSKGTRKSRLAPYINGDARERLAATMFDHVARIIAAVPRVSETIVLAEQSPSGWSGGWIRDAGRGLNRELSAARAKLADRPVLIVHADLPLLAPEEVLALIDAAAGAGAIAPDRHGTGTNALALPPGIAPCFAFGPASFARHRLAMGFGAPIVRRPGLTHDLDTLDDLHCITRALTSSPSQTNQAIAQLG